MRYDKDNPPYKYLRSLIKSASLGDADRLVGFKGEVTEGRSLNIEFNFDIGGGRRSCRALTVSLDAINGDLFGK